MYNLHIKAEYELPSKKKKKEHLKKIKMNLDAKIMFFKTVAFFRWG